MLTKTEQDRSVIKLWFTDASKEDIWFMLRSDAHHDSMHCRRDLEKKHLDKAMEKKAYILDAGDLFDAMQGRNDKRRSLDDLRPEYKCENYFGALVEEACQFYRPYSDRWILLGKGNHETAIMKYNNMDLTSILASKLRSSAMPYVGGFGGWVFVYLFNTDDSGGARSCVRIKYHHGSGWNAPVTRGVIQTNRQAVYLPDADVVWNGHNHQEYVMAMKRERITTKGNPYYDICHFVRTPGYKDDYNDSDSGWASEKGFPPAPHGCAWMKITMRDHKPKVMVYSEVE